MILWQNNYHVYVVEFRFDLHCDGCADTWKHGETERKVEIVI